MRGGDWIRKKSKDIRKGVVIISIAYRNPGLGTLPKILAFLTLAYALSPIDLIPDFIPILGLLDDLVVLPVLIFLTVKSIPGDILREARIAAETQGTLRERRWILVPVFIAAWAAIGFFIARAVVLGSRAG